MNSIFINPIAAEIVGIKSQMPLKDAMNKSDQYWHIYIVIKEYLSTLISKLLWS